MLAPPGLHLDRDLDLVEVQMGLRPQVFDVRDVGARAGEHVQQRDERPGPVGDQRPQDEEPAGRREPVAQHAQQEQRVDVSPGEHSNYGRLEVTGRRVEDGRGSRRSGRLDEQLRPLQGTPAAPGR